MAIDKIKLRHLAKDKDERLFEEGDILDALNVNISADVESSGGVVKNVNATIPGSPSTTEDSLVNVESRVIGSVSDDANGMVYFFVWTALKNHQTIYQYRSSDETYRVVLRSNQFDFQEHGFVNAVVINGEFEADDTAQTIVYFTDNHNPPRKINVDRAFSTDFNLYSDAAVKEFLSVIKSPSSFAPTTELSTDTGRTTNGLYGKVFQFATQYVYKDGEESSISPHSKITHPKYMSLQGINSASIDQSEAIDDNLVLLNTRFVDINADMSQGHVEIKRLKVLVRFNNSGSWFLVDEFDPNQDLVEADPHVNGSTNTLYTASTGIYKFYNDGLYPSLLASKTDKIYNDVPQKATSQAIVGNRLMYSSPEAGYPNVEATATLSVSYLPEPTVGSFESSSVATTNSILHNGTGVSDGWFNLDFSAAGFPATFTANTQISLTVEYKPSSFIQYGFYNNNPNGQGSSAQDLPLLKITTSDPSDPSGSLSFFCGEAEDSSNINDYSINSASEGSINCSMNASSLNWGSLVASITLTESKTKEQVLGLLAQEIKQQTVSYSFNGGTDNIHWKLRESSVGGSVITHELFAKKFDFDIAFTDVQVVDGATYGGTGTNNVLQLYPRAGNFVFPTGELGDASTNSGLTGSSTAPYVSIRDTSVQQGSGFIDANLESVESFYSGNYSPRLINGINITEGILDQWDDYTLSDTQSNGAKNSLLTSLPLSTRRTFKAGCVHEFGIVYFDEYGRPGYVNEIGSVYVHPFADVADRDDSSNGYNQGPCNISVGMTSAPPTWAKTYQIVYPGMGTFKRFETYTVGGGFKKISPTSDNAVYLSLNTLKGFQSEKGAIKDYSYTEGDRLRVVKYRNSNDTADVYPSEEIMYDVNGIEVLADDVFENYTSESGGTSNKTGTFLKVERPGGNPATGDFSNANDNLWKNSVVVEILTPRKEVEEKIYYEVGEPRRIFKDIELSSASNNNHNDGESIVLQEGDVHYRPMSMLSPAHTASHGFQANSLDGFLYKSSQAESMDVSDFVSSRVWSKGRAHVKYEKAATINYYNRIVYSEEYGDDIGGLTFSSFNPGALSYKNLPKNYGAINFIGNYNQSIAALQENKLSFIPVHRNIIEYADGASSITVSKEVTGDHKESSGDFGCGEDRSSVLIRDGIIFFADKSRQKILAAAGGKLKAISDVEMSSFFEDEFDSLSTATGDGGRLVSGFDPVENMYLFTIEPKTNGSTPDYLGVTVGYSISKGRWISRYSFVPSNYASIDNKLISAKWYQNQAATTSFLFNAHSDPLNRNKFYGTPYSSSITVVSKISPSKPKVFNALSYEGNSSSWSVPSLGISTNLNQSAGGLSTWSEKEGSYYAAMPRDTSSNSTSQKMYVGTLSYVSSGGNTILTSTIRLNRLNIPIGVELYLENGTLINVLSVSGNTMTISGSVPQANGQDHIILNDSNGDPIRGHFAEITMNNAQATAHELYCINTHITESKANHAKGQ